MLGPYARTDFWSRGLGAAMPVPFWSRDAEGSGTSRQMEVPCTPADDRSPPFTCGSVTRKRIMKKFVRDYVNGQNAGASLTETLVKQKVTELIAAWNGATDSFLCNSPDSQCTEGFPDALNVGFDEIGSSSVLQAVFNQVPAFLKDVYTENDAFGYQSTGDERGLDIWNWDELGFSGIARDSGLFHPSSPIVEYSSSEAGWPFRNDTTLWDMCTSLIAQVMFSMPLRKMDKQWVTSTAATLLAEGHEFDYTVLKDFSDDEVPDPSDGVTALERYVSALLMDAFRHSSLFWHYSLRHSPTDSLACDGEDPEKINALFKFNLDDYTALDNPLHSITFPIHGYRAFPIGGSNRSCLCSWPLLEGLCVIPESVCTGAGLSSCSYELHSEEADSTEAAVLAYWTTSSDPVVACPETDLSDSWGVIVERHNLFSTQAAVSRRLLSETLGFGIVERRDWKELTTADDGTVFEIPGSQLVEFSPSGIRLGNLDQMKTKIPQSVNPKARVKQLRTSKGTVAIRRCGSKILESIATEDFLQDVVDDLFPVSQGVKESRPISVCLRFTIEYLRKRLLMVMQSNGVPSLDENIERQEAIVGEWRARCSAQLDMLGVCNSNRIFNIVPTRIRDYNCPFKVADSENVSTYYVTSGCIMFLADDDAFFDPCAESSLCTSQSLTLDEVRLCQTCPLPLDVREIGANDTLGVFPVRFLSGNSTHDEEMSVLGTLLRVEREEGKSELPWRLMPAFARVISGGSAVGNVPHSKSWWDAEGFAGQNNSALFCDAIQDWWPLNWTMPAGYHVTLPCKDPVHRTFDSAFAVRFDADGNKFMVFHSMLLRNQTSFANDHGVGGFCRRSNYGMALHTVNTMRVCTKDAQGVKFDPSVPIKPSWPEGAYGDEYCSQSAFDTPWNIDDATKDTVHPGMFSVGHVPFYFAGTDAYYPRYVKQLVHVRPGVNDTTWSNDCGNDEVFECTSKDDCQLIDGVTLPANSVMECFRGVCIILDPGYCYAHEHCTGTGQMCSGEGRCESMAWQIHNDLPDDDVDFDLFTKNCSSNVQGAANDYDMWGASHWHDIPDVLNFYGLCGYRSWYEYLNYVKSMTYEDEMQGLDALTKLWADTGAPVTAPAELSLWELEKFRVHAHACDRDYMHLEGFQGCAPSLDETDYDVSGIFYEAPNGQVARDDSRGDETHGRYARTFSRREQGGDLDIFVHVGKLARHDQHKSLGFLSQSESFYDFSYCKDEPQCIKDMYANTYQGVPMRGERKVLESGQLRPWRWSDKTQCGVYGILQEGECHLDSAILPLYHIVCVKGVNVCGISFQSACSNIQTTYGSTGEQISAVASLLNGLWNKLSAEVGNAADETDNYIRRMTCSTLLYDEFEKLACDNNEGETAFCTPYHEDARKLDPPRITGGYYVSEHTYREFPFLFWQKCALMQGKTLDEAATHCGAWMSKRTLSELTNEDDIQSNEILLQFDAGLTEDDRIKWRNDLNSQVKAYFTILKGNSDWESYLHGWPNPFVQCRDSVVYNSKTECLKPIVNLALDPANAVFLQEDCRDFVMKNGTDSVQEFLKEHAIDLALAGTYAGALGNVNFLRDLSDENPWSRLTAAQFTWNDYEFYGLDILNKQESWQLVEGTSINPRVSVHSVRESTLDSGYLTCPSTVLNGRFAGEDHCTAVYNFVNDAITTLTTLGDEWDEAGGTLAFKWAGVYGTDTMTSANSQLYERCKEYMREGIASNWRPRCKSPDMFSSEFCQRPENVKNYFAAKQNEDDANQGFRTLMHVPFSSFCSMPCYNNQCEWACINVPKIYGNWDHRDKLYNAWTGKNTIRTKNDFLTRLLKHVVKWRGKYTELDDELMRRVFYADYDGKKAWRFMAQAYKGVKYPDKRHITQYCDREPDVLPSLNLNPDKLTNRTCTPSAQPWRSIFDNDKSFQEWFSSAFALSFINEAYKFIGNVEDVIGCYNGNVLFKSERYATDDNFKLRTSKNKCAWNCSVLKSYFPACVNLQDTTTIVSRGYELLQASSMKHFASTFKIAPPKPRALNFHTGSAEWSSFQKLDLETLVKFENDISKLGTMFSCAEGSPELVYGTCNQSDAYLNASQSYRSHVMMRGGARIPKGRTLFFGGLSRAHGIASTLPTWSNHSRESRKMFGKWAMDPAQTCTLSDPQNSVCISIKDALNQYQRYVSSPWLGGAFNPFELCDTEMSGPLTTSSTVAEVIDAGCHPEWCVPGSDTQSYFQGNMSVVEGGTPCYSALRNNQLVKKPNIPRTVDQYNEAGEFIPHSSRFPPFNNNLCAAKPISLSECKHAQGMLGARKGNKVNDFMPSQRALYTTVVNSAAEDQSGRALFLHGGNPLYTEGDAQSSDSGDKRAFLSSSDHELGGTHLVLKVTKNAKGVPVMFVDKAPLACFNCTTPQSRVKNSMSSNKTHGLFGWLKNLRVNILAEEATIDLLYPIAKPSNVWSCPLRRIAFYSKVVDEPDFSPLVPNPLRAARLFNWDTNTMNFNSRSHPTQKHDTLRRLPDIFTVNGFCMCPYVGAGTPTASNCQFESTDLNCGYQATLSSIYDQQWRDWTVKKIPLDTKCTDQLDWPYENGTMRDSTTKRVGQKSTCDVTDRLPKFKFRYVNSGMVQKHVKNSLDQGGACHMGIPGAWEGLGDQYRFTSSQLCTKANETDENITVVCLEGEDPTLYTLQKQTIQAPEWAAQAMREQRVRCNECSPLPKWEYVHNQGSGSYQVKNLTSPEVSYGIPFRWSSARLLAASAKSAICGSRSNQTEACLSLLNQTSWQGNNFMRLFTEGGVEKLLQTPVTEESPGLTDRLNEPWMYTEDDIWNASGWVACTQASPSKCYGTIPKSTWLGEGRYDACHDEYRKIIRSGDVPDNAVGIDVCNLDAGLNELCRVLQEARIKIQESNCLLAGNCTRSKYVYSPGFYSVSNMDFSRATVINHYESYAGTTDVCPLESETEELRVRNNELSKNCASKGLEAMKQGLRVVRTVVHVVVKAQYIYLQLQISLCKLFVSAVTLDTAPVVREIEFWFQHLVNIIFDAIEELGNIFYRLIMNTGGFGEALQNIVLTLCQVFQWLVANVWNTILCPIMKNVVAPVLQGIAAVIRAVMLVIPIDTGELFDHLDSLIDKLYNLGCNDSLSCQDMDFIQADTPTGDLPVATRCFVDYTPSLDDDSPYSCTRSDTCINPAFTYGSDDPDRFQVCDLCPVNIDLNVLNRYGCDMYQQTCSCATPKVERTYCTKNDECYLQGAQCAIVSDYTTGTSYGTMPCGTLTDGEPVCLRLQNSVGTCSRLIQTAVSIQSCVVPGETAFASADNLCAVASRDFQTEVSYMAQWSDLSVTPCALISSGASFCVKTLSKGNIIVGVDWNTNRRLLSDAARDEDVIAPLEHPEWEHVSDPCRLLANAYNQNKSLSITEQYTLTWCFQRRDLANYTIQKLNLTRFVEGDHFLLSFTDFIDVISRRGAFYQLFFESKWVNLAMRHVPIARKLRQMIEGAILSIALTMEGNDSLLDENVTNSSELQVYRDAQVSALQVMATMEVTVQAPESQQENVAQETQDQPEEDQQGHEMLRRLLSIDEPDTRLQSLEELLAILRNLPNSFYYKMRLDRPTLSDQDQSCAAGLNIIEVVMEASQVLTHFFQTYTTNPTLGDWQLKVPSLNATGAVVSNNSTGNLFYDVVINGFLEPYFGFNAQSAANFFSVSEDMPTDAFTLKNSIQDMIKCDFEEVMLCKKPRRRLLTAFFMALVMYLAVSYILQSVALPFPMWIFIPLMTLYLAYGTAPTCIPMLSTCLWTDLIDTLNVLAPTNFYWPQSIQRYPGCLPTMGVSSPTTPPQGNESILLNTPACLKPCTSLGFDGPLASLAWITCSISQDSCRDLDIPIIGGMGHYTAMFYPIISDTDATDLRDAHSYCFFTTLGSSAPIFFLLVVAIIIFFSFARVPFQIFAATLQTMVQAVCYTHAKQAELSEE